MRIARYVCVTLLYTTILFGADPAAQQGNPDAWRWVHFGAAQGVPSMIFHGIVRQRDSSVWVGTETGLLRFDGFQWLPFVPAGLRPAQSIIYGDLPSGLTIIGNGNTLYRCGGGVCKAVGDVPIEAVPVNEDDILVRRGIRISLITRGVEHPLPDHPRLDTTDGRRFLWQGRYGSAWLNAREGLYRWSEGQWHRMLSSSGGPIMISDLAEGPEGKVYFVRHLPVQDRGIWELDEHGRARLIIPGLLGSKVCGAMTCVGPFLAFQVLNDLHLRNANGSLNTVRLPFDGHKVTSLLIDTCANVWMTTTEGIWCYWAGSRRWDNYDSPGSPKNNIHELLRVHDGTLWAGTQNGISIYSSGRLVRSLTEILGVQLHDVTGLAEDRNGLIWVTSGSSFRGAFSWDGSVWQHHRIGDAADLSIGGSFFHRIKPDRSGNLWFLGVGAKAESGRQPGAFRQIDSTQYEQWGEAQGLANGRVYAFVEGPDHAYWFGTMGGVSRWKNGGWTHWRRGEAYQGSSAFTLAIDRNGTAWVADRNFVIMSITETSPLKMYSTADGLPSITVWDLRAGPDGRVWAATENGAAEFVDSCWVSYDARSGLAHTSLWPVLPLGDEVLLGTLGSGIVSLHPDDCAKIAPRIEPQTPLVEAGIVLLHWKSYGYWNEPAPDLIETRYRINGGPWSPWGTRREVEVTGLEHGSYSYEVQGKDISGLPGVPVQCGTFQVPPTLSRNPAFVIPITLLTTILLVLSGLYVVRMRSNHRALQRSELKFRRLTESTFDGILVHDNGVILEANEALAAMFGYAPSEFIGMTVGSLFPEDTRTTLNDMQRRNTPGPVEIPGLARNNSPLWVEITENALPSVSATARIAAIRNITGRKRAEEQLLSYQGELKNLALALSKLEQQERRRIATYLHDDLSQTLGFCRMKLGTMTGEVSTKDLSEVRGYIEEMFDKTQSLTFELSPPILFEIGLEAAIGSLAERMSAEHNMAFTLRRDAQSLEVDETIRLLLFYAVRELLINVVKHAQATAVQVTIRVHASTARISVVDNGKGFSDGADGTASGGGFGLVNIRERLAHLGGALEIDRARARGAAITIVLPLDSQRRTTSEKY